MSSTEGDQACAWCTSGAVGASCQTTSDAQALPSSVFECEYQQAEEEYAPYEDTDCSKCTGDSPCAPCNNCLDNKSGPCAPCWSSDNSAGTACLPSCASCYDNKSYANGRLPPSTSVVAKENSPQLSSTAECNTYNYLKKAGFPQSSLATMVCISKYESSWNCKATNKNVDGSTDYGLMQINSYYWCSGDPTSKYNECGTSCDSLFDCQKNANCAYKVYREQGYNAWYGYKNHKAECDSYQVNC